MMILCSPTVLAPFFSFFLSLSVASFPFPIPSSLPQGFIRVIGSELVQKYVGEGARMVRELFQMARSKKACIIFFDEIDAIGGARNDDGAGGDNEVQRTMLQIVTELDGFDSRGNIKVLMATNRPDTLDPALMRPGRLDRKIEFSLPDLQGRTNILAIHSKSLNWSNSSSSRHSERVCGATLALGLSLIVFACFYPSLCVCAQ